MNKITPHLWYDKEAIEAAKLYTSVFKDSRIKNTTQIHNTPSGSVDILNIEVLGQSIQMINAGPPFKFTPAVSFLANLKSEKEVDEAFQRLSEGGKILMELGKYPFSEKYGWVEDRYGLSWQLSFSRDRSNQGLIPVMMFVGEVCGKAEEAMNHYVSIFRNAKINDIFRYEKGEEPDKEGTVKWSSFHLENQEFAAMDSARKHDFTFNEAISFIVYCSNQEEIDYYWEKLSADPKSEQCGWLKDKFGMPWQIVPEAMENMMKTGDKERIGRVTEAFLKMKKFDLKKLEEAFEGK